MEISEMPSVWGSEAACRTMDLALFYPASGKVKRELLDPICDSCPVFDKCLLHALNSEGDGYWAKTTEEERRVIRRERGFVLVRPEDFHDKSKSVCGTYKGYRRHLRENKILGHKGVTCKPCLEAHVVYNKESYFKRKAQGVFI